MEHTFAIPLWAIIDEAKVEPGKSDTRMLAKQLGRWLQHNLDLVHKGTAIEPHGNEPVLIIAGVAQAQWATMIALAQSQQCSLFLVLPNGQGQHYLRPLDLPKSE
jgi:hypothetical protein